MYCSCSDSENGDSVRIECFAEGTSINVDTIRQQITDIVSGSAFYIPDTIAISSKPQSDACLHINCVDGISRVINSNILY